MLIVQVLTADVCSVLSFPYKETLQQYIFPMLIIIFMYSITAIKVCACLCVCLHVCVYILDVFASQRVREKKREKVIACVYNHVHAKKHSKYT